MAYSEYRSGSASVLFNLAADTLLIPKSAISVASSSNSGRLMLTLPASASGSGEVLTMVALGQFSYSSSKATLANVSGSMTELSTYRNGELIAQVSYGGAFDIAQLGAATTAEALAQQSYELRFMGGNDIFAASRIGVQTDQINGLSGNDVFYGYGGNDYFDGGSGLDTSVLRGNRAQYTLSKAGTTYMLKDNVGQRDDTDTLINVERLQFLDKILALDTAGTAGMGYRIYKAAFNRSPDASGLGYWITKMDRGMDLIEVAARFIDSGEFQSLYGSQPTDAEFLTKVYANVLQRAPDASGYGWWLGQLSTNPQKTWQKVLADFSESPENQQNVAQLIGAGILYDPASF